MTLEELDSDYGTGDDYIGECAVDVAALFAADMLAPLDAPLLDKAGNNKVRLPSASDVSSSSAVLVSQSSLCCFLPPC